MSADPGNVLQPHVTPSRDAVVLQAQKQKQKRGDAATMARTSPERHIHRRTLGAAMRQSPWLAAWSVGAPIAIGVMVWMFLTVTFSISSTASGGGPPLGAMLAAGLFSVLITAGLLAGALSAQFTDLDKKAVDAYAMEAPHIALARLASLRREDGPDSDVTFVQRLDSDVAFLQKLSQDERPEIADVRRRTGATIYAIHVEYNRAHEALGTASKTDIDADAASAIMTTIAAARRDVCVIETGIHEHDAKGALPVAQEFSVRMAQLASGTETAQPPSRPAVIGNAVASRIVENARKALEIDPDMADDAGARVDALVDEHLPSLLRRHADAARHARVEDLRSINADLEEGIELIRRSVEQGLSRIRTEKAQDLRTEIAFLQARGGGGQTLRSLP